MPNRAELSAKAGRITRAAATAPVADDIDNFDNPVRRQSTIWYASPTEYELNSQ